MRALVLALALALGACTTDTVVGGTVESVREVDLSAMEGRATSYEHPLVPEVAWKVTVRLDDGAEVTFVRGDERRYEPGERVRLINSEDGPLLL
jgi:outer membrane lipoprotein SlyB